MNRVDLNRISTWICDELKKEFMRQPKALSQEALAVSVDTYRQKISDILNGNRLPTITELYAICDAFNCPPWRFLPSPYFEDDVELVSIDKPIIDAFLNGNPSLFNDPAYISSEAHTKRLKRYTKSKFIAFYMDTSLTDRTKAQPDEQGYLSFLCISSADIDSQGFIPFDFNVTEGHKYFKSPCLTSDLSHISFVSDYTEYTGKIISPPEGKHTYFYFANANRDKPERGVMVISHHSNERYSGGLGYLLSNTRGKSPERPCIQRIAFIQENTFLKICTKEGLYAAIHSHLKLPETPKHDYVMHMRGLTDASNDFYKLIKAFEKK